MPVELMHGQVVKQVNVLIVHGDDELRELFNLSSLSGMSPCTSGP
jgi:hypothetical protein